MKWLDALRQPPPNSRPITIWGPDPSWDAADVDRQLRAIRDRGWGGVMLDDISVESLLIDEDAPGFFFPAMQRARELGLSVWLHGGPLFIHGAVARELALSEPKYRLQLIQYIDRKEVLSGESVRWELSERLDQAFILGMTEGGRAMDITQLYRGGVVEGMAPLAVDRFFAFDILEVAERIHPFRPDAMRALYRETFGLLADVFREERTLVDGVFLPPEEVDFALPMTAPWCDEMAEAFTLLYKTDVLESLPFLFTPDAGGEGHRWLFRGALKKIWREALLEPLTTISERMHWKFSGLSEWNEPPFPSSPLPPSTPVLDWLNGGQGWGVLGDDDYDSIGDLAAIADREFLHGSRQLVNFYPGLVAKPRPNGGANDPTEDPTEDPLEPWIDGFNRYAARIASFAQSGAADISVLALDPFGSAQAAFSLDPHCRQRAMEWEHSLRETEDALQSAGYTFDWMPEGKLDALQFDEEGYFTLSTPNGAKRRYAVLLISSAVLLPESTMKRIEGLAFQGGLVLFAGDYPSVVADNGATESSEVRLKQWMEECETVRYAASQWLPLLKEWVRPVFSWTPGSAWLRTRPFHTEDGPAYLMSNASPDRYLDSILTPSGAQTVYIADLDTAKVIYEVDANTSLPVELESNGSLFLLASTTKPDDALIVETPQTRSDVIPVPEPFFFHAQNGNDLLLHEWMLSQTADPTARPGEFVMEHRYTTWFQVLETFDPALLIAYGLDESDILSINGGYVDFEVDYGVALIPIEPFLVLGRNTIEVVRCVEWGEPRPAPSPCWIHGDFAVVEQDGDLFLATPSLKMPAESWADNGYPFYAGVGVYRQNVVAPEEHVNRRLALTFSDVCSAVDVYINGERVGKCWRAPWRLDITGKVKAGQNLFVFHAANQNRNRYSIEACPAGILGPVSVEVFERVL
ncbi:MAG: hypothetical protein P9L94_15615 [Candidatus Hinthialibacter antarcticus]|nr:hypothetical protein [Candidatus Hinthialibacter antarcticus]